MMLAGAAAGAGMVQLGTMNSLEVLQGVEGISKETAMSMVQKVLDLPFGF